MLNSAHQSADDDYYNRPRPSILSRIKEGRNRVLDLGCGSGAVGRALLESGKAAEIVGVELFDAAARTAAKHYTKVYAGDVETLELPFSRAFDYVICGDILEHLREPAAVIRRVSQWLKDDGVFICSVPNVRYWRVLYELVFKGSWEYVDSGVLDKTHLRFFTRSTFSALVADAGFDITSSQMLIFGRRYQLVNRLTMGMLDGFLGSQLVIVAKKAGLSAQ